MDLTKFKKKLIISRDAGAANMIFNYLKSHKSKSIYECYLENPAKKIFKGKNFIKLNNISNLHKYNLLITGTSINNKLELQNIKAAKNLGIYTITFLDHWTNYKKRFLLKKKTILPNEIIAFDNTSLSLAKKIFKNQIIKNKTILKKVNNSYFKTANHSKKNKLLLLSSNYDSLKKKGIDDKKIIYNFFQNNYIFLKKKKIKNFYLKSHPSEQKKKFIPLIKKLNIKFNIDLKIIDKELKKITSTTKYVAGYNSMGLVIAKLSDCTTYEIRIERVKSDIPSKYIDRYF
jgi:hypothetical protein